MKIWAMEDMGYETWGYDTWRIWDMGIWDMGDMGYEKRQMGYGAYGI